ncbi:MAG: hypothetical protein ACI4OJ_04500, partial [Lachnospiraceae bacterium]
MEMSRPKPNRDILPVAGFSVDFPARPPVQHRFSVTRLCADVFVRTRSAGEISEAVPACAGAVF